MLSYVLTTANVHNSKVAPVLFQDIEDQHVLFSIADAVYDSQHPYHNADMCDIFLVNLINLRHGQQIKSSNRRVLSYLITTIFGKQSMKEPGKIE